MAADPLSRNPPHFIYETRSFGADLIIGAELRVFFLLHALKLPQQIPPFSQGICAVMTGFCAGFFSGS